MDRKALGDGIKEAAIEAVKMVPGVGILIEGVRAYQESIKEQQRQNFVNSLAERLLALEGVFSKEWYNTPKGQVVTKKVIASALNAEYAEKIEYFANALLNSSKDFRQEERLKFLEILRHVSKPALQVLACKVNTL